MVKNLPEMQGLSEEFIDRGAWWVIVHGPQRVRHD